VHGVVEEVVGHGAIIACGFSDGINLRLGTKRWRSINSKETGLSFGTAP
jgi:hypothetical protein